MKKSNSVVGVLLGNDLKDNIDDLFESESFNVFKIFIKWNYK